MKQIATVEWNWNDGLAVDQTGSSYNILNATDKNNSVSFSSYK